MAAPTVSAGTAAAAVWDNRRMAPQARIIGIAFIGIALIAGISAALIWRNAAAPAELTTGAYIHPNRALPDFSLIDTHGQTFGSAQLRGHWSMMFFGYTNCPDFCPTTLTTLAALERQLRTTGSAAPPQVIFVSV